MKVTLVAGLVLLCALSLTTATSRSRKKRDDYNVQLPGGIPIQTALSRANQQYGQAFEGEGHDSELESFNPNGMDDESTTSDN